MDFSRLSALASGHVESRILQVAVSLKLFDLLDNAQRTTASMAAALRTDPRATELLLNALVAMELLDKRGEEFALTSVAARYLITASPQYYGSMVLFDGSLWSSWSGLQEAVRSGNPVRPADMYQGDSKETERFILAMDSLVKARGDAAVVAGMLDLTGVKEMLDVGPGPATYVIELCKKYPLLHATLFDLPETMKFTRRFVEASGLVGRIRLVTGDYRTDTIPGSYGLIFLSNIIHSEGVEENRALLKKLYGCLGNRGRIVIKDHILDGSHTQPCAGAIFALLMLLTTRLGQCYSADEVKAWLESAGLPSVEEFPLPSPMTSSLIIATKS